MRRPVKADAGARSACTEALHQSCRQLSAVHLQGIQGHGYYDTCVVPIIENTARECELTDSLREAILKYPQTSAVLVRRHGVYVWGKDWIHAKTQVRLNPMRRQLAGAVTFCVRAGNCVSGPAVTADEQSASRSAQHVLSLPLQMPSVPYSLGQSAHQRASDAAG